MSKVSSKKLLLVFAAAVVGATVTLAALPIWLNRSGNLSAAEREGAAHGKPVLLEFSASWCGPCQYMKQSTLANPRVAHILLNYVVCSIDVDSDPETTRQFAVETLPHFFVIDSKSGKVIKENGDGAIPAEDFLAWLNSANDGDPSIGRSK